MRWPAVFVLAAPAGRGDRAGASPSPRYIPHAVDPTQDYRVSH